MPLAHLLWRLLEGKPTPLSLAITCRCTWPYCPVNGLDMMLEFSTTSDPKPADATCPLCQRSLQVLSAKPLVSG
jgi:hypothetical protein